MPVKYESPSPAPVSSGHRQGALQCENRAAILFPYVVECSALKGAHLELDIGIGRHRLVQLGLEHNLAIVAAGEAVDDFARDELALLVLAQAGLHRMGDQRPNDEDLAACGGAWHVDAWQRCRHRLPPCRCSSAAV